MKQDLPSDVTVLDDRVCVLGESPLWHPSRHELFWVDLPTNTLLCNKAGKQSSWKFDEMVSAIGWVDHQTLLLAMESSLVTFSLVDASQTVVTELEKDKPQNRSNDGRADPWGGFWISTMHKEAQAEMGSIYRWYQGELRQLVTGISIPNAICFNRCDSLAYFADSAIGQVNSLELDAQTGWPTSEPRVFIDVSSEGCDPDGAIIDQDGNMWIAMWDAFEVRQYSAGGDLMKKINLGTQRPTCPAFFGEDASQLVVTTAAYGLEESDSSSELDGTTLIVDMPVAGFAEPAVSL